MSRADATVSGIWRYPVKSMLGEELDASRIGERGLAGDRAYALVDTETGFVASAKNPRRWGALFGCRAAFLEPPDVDGDVPPVRITLPDGATVRSDDPAANDALSRALGRAVTVQTVPPAEATIEDLGADDESVPAARRGTVHLGRLAPLAPGTFFDAAPVHVLTTSTLAALEAAFPSGRFEPARFRPNVVVDTGEQGFVENAWVDRFLDIGDDVAVHVLLSAPRCIMTTLPQGELPADRGILRTVARENRFDIPGLGPSSCAGVYGIVAAAGTVSRGDVLRVRTA